MAQMLVLFERNKKIITRTVTAKSEAQSVRDDIVISPAGLILLLSVKN